MPMTVLLQDEAGRVLETVQDPRGVIVALIDGSEALRASLLKGVDPYGDTVFNRVQMEQFLREWETITRGADTGEARLLLLAIRPLAEKCRDGVHLYLKFIGD